MFHVVYFIACYNKTLLNIPLSTLDGIVEQLFPDIGCWSDQTAQQRLMLLPRSCSFPLAKAQHTSHIRNINRHKARLIQLICQSVFGEGWSESFAHAIHQWPSLKCQRRTPQVSFNANAWKRAFVYACVCVCVFHCENYTNPSVATFQSWMTFGRGRPKSAQGQIESTLAWNRNGGRSTGVPSDNVPRVPFVHGGSIRSWNSIWILHSVPFAFGRIDWRIMIVDIGFRILYEASAWVDLRSCLYAEWKVGWREGSSDTG